MSERTVKVPPVRFSADEDELLIEFVQNHTILYDLKDREFKNTLKKDLIWNEAGKVLNREGQFLFILNMAVITLSFSRSFCLLLCNRLNCTLHNMHFNILTT